MSKRKYPTASQLPRAFSCLYPWRLHVEWKEDAPGYPARVGSAVHKLIEYTLCGEDHGDAVVDAVAHEYAVDMGDVARLFDRWKEWHATQVGVEGDAEVAWAYCPVEHHSLRVGARIGRAYPAPLSHYIVGTADLCSADTVTDWKTSLGPDSTAAPAADNEQLHALAAMSGASKVRLVVITDDGVRVDEAPARKPEHTLARMTSAMLTIELDNAGPNPGSHCAYCPAAHACPATTQAQTAIVGAAQPTLDLSTPDGIYHARVYLKLVDDARDRLDAAIKDAVKAAGGRIDLGNGRALKLSSRTRETIQWSDAEKAAAKFDGRVKTSTYEVLTEGKA